MSFVAGIGPANCDIFFLGLERLPREGEELFATGFDIQPGGGAPATLTILSRLNVPVELATFLGDDEFSGRVRRALDEGGVPYLNLYEGDGRPTIISATAVTANNRTFLSYIEPAKLTPELRARVARRFAGARVMEMQIGTLEVCRDVRALNPDVMFVLDTGWDDNLSLENYREYLALADYYTPNRGEAMKITGTDSPLKALYALREFFERPIVKLDGEGCLVMRDGQAVLVPPMPGVRMVDATGAGDAFLAGLMYGLFHGKDIVDCVRYGNVVGGACVERVGCLSGYVDEPELLRRAEAIIPREATRA